MKKWSKRHSAAPSPDAAVSCRMAADAMVSDLNQSETASAASVSGHVTESSLNSASTRVSTRRRRFLGQAGLLATGIAGSAIFATPAQADCDNAEDQLRRCSDNDTGDDADPRGCGRCGRSNNAPARRRISSAFDGSPADANSAPESSAYKPLRARRIDWSAGKK